MYFTNSECCCFRAVILSLCIADSVWMSFFRMLKQPSLLSRISASFPSMIFRMFSESSLISLIPNRHGIPSPHCFDRNRVFQLVSETLDIYRQRVVFHKAAAFVPDAFENLTPAQENSSVRGEDQQQTIFQRSQLHRFSRRVNSA